MYLTFLTQKSKLLLLFWAVMQSINNTGNVGKTLTKLRNLKIIGTTHINIYEGCRNTYEMFL